MPNIPEEPKKLLQFPCEFPIKIVGREGFEFESDVITIIRRHHPQLSEGAIQLKHSQKGNYLAITATLYVESQEQLDALYQELVACKNVIMVL